jgi:hypothetical protein
MQAQDKGGRPRLPRLGTARGSKLKKFVRDGREAKALTLQKFTDRISEELLAGYEIGNTATSVGRKLQIAYAGGPLSLPYVECIEKVLARPMPQVIKNAVSGLARPKCEAIGTSSILKPHAFDRYLGRLPTPRQRTAADEQIRLLNDALQNIGRGRIQLRMDSMEYFQSFFDFVRAGATMKHVKVFARLVNLVARGNLGRFGPREFFPTCRDLVQTGLLNIEYIIFLYGRNELNIPEVKQILREYKSFAASVHLHFATETDLTDGEISQTIALWSPERVFTHGWDYRGNIENLTEWAFRADHESFKNLFHKIKTRSEPYSC